MLFAIVNAVPKRACKSMTNHRPSVRFTAWFSAESKKYLPSYLPMLHKTKFTLPIINRWWTEVGKRKKYSHSVLFMVELSDCFTLIAFTLDGCLLDGDCFLWRKKYYYVIILLYLCYYWDFQPHAHFVKLGFLFMFNILTPSFKVVDYSSTLPCKPPWLPESCVFLLSYLVLVVESAGKIKYNPQLWKKLIIL